MISFPPCKINLGLNVISKREDGYHNLETIFYPVPWTDILEIIPSDVLTFESTGLSIPGKEDDNICLKAYHLLRKDYSLSPVKIHLHKIIPMGAGLGGGSSDGAHALKLLNEIFKLSLSHQQLAHYAAQLGSDCSFFLQSQPMIGSGRGEILQPLSLSLKGKFFVLVKPDIHVSTAEAYSEIRPVLPEVSCSKIVSQPITEWKKLLKNDFEFSVFKKHPAIKNLKEEMYSLGAEYAAMSGSGSSVFGIFEKEISLPDHFKKMIHRSGLLD